MTAAVGENAGVFSSDGGLKTQSLREMFHALDKDQNGQMVWRFWNFLTMQLFLGCPCTAPLHVFSPPSFESSYMAGQARAQRLSNRSQAPPESAHTESEWEIPGL